MPCDMGIRLLLCGYVQNDAKSMSEPALQARAIRVAEICRQQHISQSVIADAVGASQPQVSRILNGKGLRRSRLFEEVCLYVERHAGGVTPESVRQNDELINALAQVWDGSAAHARALSTVIRALDALGTGRR